MTLREMQRRVYQNKLNHRFNVTDVPLEFCLLSGEVAETFDAWNKKKDSLGEEMADVAIYLLGLAEICGVDLQGEIERKMEINEKRCYVRVDGVLQKKLPTED